MGDIKLENYIKTQVDITDRNLKDKNFHLHKYRHDEYANWLKDHLNMDMKVLDIGCRDGSFLESLRNVVGVWQLWGIELNETASMIAGDKGIMVYNIDAHNISCENLPSCEMEFYDLVCMTHLLEHTHSPLQVLKEALRVLKKGGLLFIEVPLEPMLKSNEDHNEWGHYFTFQSHSDLIKLLGMVRREQGYDFETVKDLKDEKKNKWYRLLVRKL